jgi:hypothetical protein
MGYFDAPFLAADIEYRPNGIVSGDFNGDDIPDLAVANSAYGVSVLIGNGNGLFQPYISFDVRPWTPASCPWTSRLPTWTETRAWTSSPPTETPGGSF